MTKRGRGQRRNRRLKNRSLSEARAMALRHLRYNPPQLWGPGPAAEIADLTAFFRRYTGLQRVGVA